MTLHLASPIPFAALILFVQCNAEGYGRDPLSATDAERYIENLTDVGYARLIEAFRGD